MVSERLAFDILARDHASQTFKKIGRSTDDVHRKFGFLSSRTKNLAAGMRVSFGAVAGVMGGIAAISVFKGFISEAEEAKKVSASTAQGIKTIGAGSWTSVKAIEALATATSKKIGVDDELIQTSANLLLTFKNIKNAAGANNDIFNRSVVAAQDLAAKGFGSAESAAKMLGKALNDPVKGMTALGRAGVTFSEKQKEVIKKLVESGDILGAQKIIMKEVEDQVGGTAAATVTGTEKMKVAWANFQEWIGTKLLPVIEKIETVIVDKVIPAMQSFVDFLGRTALPAVVNFGKMLAEKFIPIDKIKGAFKSLTSFVSDFVAGLQGKSKIGVAELFGFQRSDATKLGQTIRDLFTAGISAGIAGVDWGRLGATLGEAIITAVGWIARNISKLTKAFIGVLGKVDWFKVGTDLAKTAIPFALGFITGFINNVLDPGLWIGLIAHHWQELLFAVITVAFTPGKIIGSIGKALARIPFVGKMLEWLLLSFARISKSAVAMVGRFLGRLFGAFAKGLLGEGRTRILQDVWAWLQLIPQRIREFIPVAQKWVRHLIGRMADAIEGAAGAVGRAIRTVIRIITAPFRGAANWLFWVGRNVISGLTRGIWAAIKGIGGWIKARVVDPIVNAVKRFFGIKSPSTVMAGIGGNLIKGLIKGLSVTNGAAIARKIFGSMPKALAAIVDKGLVSIASLPGKALKALGSVAGFLGGGVTGTRTFARGNVQLGQQLAAQLYGWTGNQWQALFQLWQHESGWNSRADNPTSTAFGIPQFLASTARAYGLSPGDTNPTNQIVAGLRYISNVYGTPMRAWGAWLNRSPHWYEKGTPWVPQTGLAMLHRGEAVIPAKYNRGGGGGITINGGVHVHGVQDINGLVAELQRYAKRNGGIKIRTFA